MFCETIYLAICVCGVGLAEAKTFDIQIEDAEEEIDYTIKDDDHELVKAVLTLSDYNFQTVLRSYDLTRIAKFNEKFKEQKNSDRVIDLFAKNIPQLVLLEDTLAM